MAGGSGNHRRPESEDSHVGREGCVLVFSGEARNVVRDQILWRLVAACDRLWVIAERNDLERTRAQLREVREDLQLLDEVGWERDVDKAVSITLPRDQWRSALSRHCHHALLRGAEGLEEEEKWSPWNARRNRFLVSTLTRALAELAQQ